MNYPDVNPNFDMLLTSVGPTTEPTQERLLELGRNAAKLSDLNILVVADGWSAFRSDDKISFLEQMKHKAESQATKLWTYGYIKYVLGNAAIRTETLAQLNESEGLEVITASDMLIVPGGNTYLTMRGLRAHDAAVQSHVDQGKPYIGNSAGSIAAGLTIRPAGVEPADKRPHGYDMADEAALGLLNFDIAPHAPGRKGSFDMPGPLPKLAAVVWSALETSPLDMEYFVSQRQSEGVDVETLDDEEGLSVSNGMIKKI